MGKGRHLSVLAVASISGFLGGVLSTRTQSVGASAPETVRATRFELVNEAGNTIAFWGSDEHRHLVLAFLDENKNERGTFGIYSDGAPHLEMADKDGKIRATLYLGWQDKPLLGMGDADMEGRVLLGFIESDAPSPRDDDWGLILRAPRVGPHREMAYIAVMRDYEGAKSAGKIMLRDSEGKTWSAP